MTPLLTFLAAGTLLSVVAVYLVHEALEYEKQYKILKSKKEHQYNNNMEPLFTDLLDVYNDARSLYNKALRNPHATPMSLLVPLNELEHTMLKAKDNLNEFVQKLKEK